MLYEVITIYGLDTNRPTGNREVMATLLDQARRNNFV